MSYCLFLSKLLQNNYPSPFYIFSIYKYILFMMEKSTQFIASFDLFRAEPSLRYKGKSYVGSVGLGILSLIIIGLFIALFWQRVNQATSFKGNTVSYSEYEQRPLQAEIKNFMFALKFSSHQLDDDPFQYENYYSISAQFKSSQDDFNKTIMLKPCRLQQWTRLGINYTKIFQTQNLRKAYCPPSQNGLNITGIDINEDNFMRLKLTECNPNLNKKCVGRQKIGEKLFPQKNFHYFRMQVVMLVERPSISQKIPYLTFMTKVLTKTPFSPTKNSSYEQSLSFTSYVRVELTQFQIQPNDKVRIFVESNQLYRGHSIVNSQQILASIMDKSYPVTFLSCKFSFNQNKVVYIRSVTNIIDITSYIGGIIEIIVSIILLFIGTYNELKYQLSIGGSFFSCNSDGWKVKPEDFNIWQFFKIKIYRLITILFCLRPKWNYTKQILQTIQESEKCVDIKRLFRRLDYLQKIIASQVPKDVLKSMSIGRLMTIPEVQDQRKIMSYYPVIIQSKQAATVEDAIAYNQECFEYLKIQYPQYYQDKEKQREVEKQRQSICKSLFQDLGFDYGLSNPISQYPIIAKKAEQIHLTPQFQKVEEKMTHAFLNRNQNERRQWIMKVPILILHRIRMKARQINKMRESTCIQDRPPLNFIQDKGRKITLIKKIKKTITQFFQYFDLFSVQAILRTDQRPEKKTAFFGFVNFIFICIFSYVFIDLIVKMFRLDPSQLTISRYGSTDKNLKNIPNIMLAFRFPENQYSSKYGLNNILQLFNFSYTQVKDYDDYGDQDSMIPCKAEMWSLLGQSYYQYFEASQLGRAYCLKNPLNFTDVKDNSPFFKVSTSNRKCYLNQSIQQLQFSQSIEDFNCFRFLQYYRAVIAEYKFFPVWVYLLIPEVRADLADPIVFTIKQFRIPIYKSRVQLFQAYLVGTRVITYDSIWPFLQNRQERNQFAYSHFVVPDDRAAKRFFFALRLSIMAELKVTQRRVKKIDDTFSYVGGLFGFLITFFAFFFQSYNQYRYELNVGESSFNYDTDGQKFSQKSLNGLSYIKYSIFMWIKDFCCCDPNWKEEKRMQETLEEVSECLDAGKMLRRIQFMEKVIWNIYNKDFLLIMALEQNENIYDIRKKRRVMQYYDKIVKQKQAASVQDAVNQSIKSFTYLYQPVKDIVLEFKSIVTQSKYSLRSSKKQIDFKEQIKNSLMQYLQICEPISRAVSQYPEIAKQATQIELSQEWDEVQEGIAFALLALSNKKRDQIIMKMPIIILHRMRMKAEKIRKIGQFAHERYEAKQQIQLELQSYRKCLSVLSKREF